MNSLTVQGPSRPLYVDLDGTLIKQDSLHESILAVIKRHPFLVFKMIGWLIYGKAHFKHRLATWVQSDDVLPVVDPEFIDWLTQQNQQKRPLYLATASESSIAQRMAQHFGLFAGVIATTPSAQGRPLVNLAGANKLQAIKNHMLVNGFKEFDYAGNSKADLPIWVHAKQVIAVNAPKRLIHNLQQQGKSPLVFGALSVQWSQVFKAMRLTQWSKNGLLFVPLLAAHEWSLMTWGTVLLAFFAFGLLASSTYLINDLLDLSNDRRHQHKRHRPLASGALLVAHAVPLCLGLMLSGLGLAIWLSLDFFLILLAYTVTTLAYSFRLKTYPVVDVIVLSGLYSWRLFAGATVASITISNWLLTVSLFLFLGLALVKRCAELEEVTLNSDTDVARGRGYHQDDLSVLRSMGIASSFATVLVLALYIDSQSQAALYNSPGWLWGVVPILLFWLMRLWIKATRRQLHGEDPLQFALHDKTSWLVVIAMAVLASLATVGI